MSRIIVKNLPSRIKEERLRDIFGAKGCITDCQLKYTKEGHFRKFAFIGFKCSEEAQVAVRQFHKSFIDTSKIQVEIAKDFGDATKPRAWSKYSRDSSAYQRMLEKLKEKEDGKEKQKKQDSSLKKSKTREDKVSELLGELKDDAEFQDFLEVHKNRTVKASWANDTLANTDASSKGAKGIKSGKVKDKHHGNVENMEIEEDSDSDYDSEEETKDSSDTSESKGHKLAVKKDVSDLDYLKSKMKINKLLSESDESYSSSSNASSSESEEESSASESDQDSPAEENVDTSDLKERKKKIIKREKRKLLKDDTGKEDESNDEEPLFTIKKPTEDKAGSSGDDVWHLVKMKGLPASVKEDQIKEFFKPLATKIIKIPRNAKGKKSFSFATVEFFSEKDTDQAMRRNKNFIGPKRVFLYKVKKDRKLTKEDKPRPWEIKAQNQADQDDGEEESIAESGRLYVRNLAYVCKEEDLEDLFGKYGPLTEAHLPVDRLTKKVKGFAFVTFMIPEHAVKAYTELDGTVFQGRMLHILPGKAKKEDNLDLADNASFKKKKEAKQKAQAGSSHNWNSLFLGASAVADVMAEKYGTAKSQILDAEAKQSLGVRMALGETQIVAETRDFLIDNGVVLDSFSQAAAARSKTVILVKNLPAGTSTKELQDLFSRYGTLGRVLLPPSGITAIIEYTEPSEARNGFTKLAYTKFHHVPLYLEWAPIDVFKKSLEQEPTEEEEGTKQKTADTTSKAEEEESESEEEVEPESTLFVKNLNFDTSEESLKKKFGSCGPVRNVIISKKKDMKNPGKFLSMGYGFVEFKKRESAQKALKTLQHCELDDHQLELKISNRATTVENPATKKKQDPTKKQRSTKILIRNIPFEAKLKEIKELFSVFGELKSVRLPKKMSGTGSHRGFGFVDFLTKHDAKRAFNALCHSTHLYGRRLVLEWADSEETVEQLRKKTAHHFHDDVPSKRLKKASLMADLKGGEAME